MSSVTYDSVIEGVRRTRWALEFHSGANLAEFN